MKRLLLCSIFCGVPMLAQSSESIDLQHSVMQALQHAPALKAEQAAQRASIEAAHMGRAALLPYIAVNGSIQKQQQRFTYDVPIALLRTHVNNRATSYGIQLVQPLFDLAKWSRYEQAQEALKSAQSKLDLQRQTTILQTTAAWLDVVRAQAAWKAAQANESAMLQVQKQAATSFRLGAASINDSLLAGSRLDIAKAQRIHSQNTLLQAKATLASLMGQDGDMQVSLPRTFSKLPLQAPTLQAWQHTAEEHALGIELATQRKTVAQQQYMESVGEALPKVQLIASWNQSNNSDGSFGGSKVQTGVIGVEFNAPLYAGGALSDRRRQATQEKVQAEYLIADAQRNTRLATQQSWLDMQSSLSEIAALQHARHSVQQALKASHIGFEVGLKSLNDVLDAQQRVASTEQSYANAIAHYVMAWVQLHATAGVLQTQDLSAVDQLFVSQDAP